MNSLERIFSTVRDSQGFRLFMVLVLFFLVAAIVAWVAESPVNDQFASIWDAIWWVIVTFSTVGYGDKVTATVAGRIVAILVIFAGIGAVSLLSGALASVLVEQSNRTRRGLVEYRRLKDHLVVCGWKGDMREILEDIQQVAPEFTAARIVVVSNVDPEKIQELQELPHLKALKFVRGDYFSEAALRRAGADQAQKVLILADALESSAPSEVDSKTVMTCLTAKSISRDVYVTAELLDRKYENYLKTAMCDEILFSRDFARRMIANSSATNGMSHIIYELLTRQHSQSRLVTRVIPSEYQGQTWSNFREQNPDTDDRLILGILENTGSANRMKIESLREAQKTSDVSKLVANLQAVKGLETNRPLLLPPAEHVIQKYDLLIVLERAGAEVVRG